MKRFRIILLVVPLFFAGCGQINEEIESLKTRIDNLEGTTIASIEQQISSINKSLGDLSGMDMSLKAYLDVLSNKAADLEKQAGEIPTLREAINGLRAQDGTLEESIAGLKSYVDSLSEVVLVLNGSVNQKIAREREWISATFCTLENYQAMATEIAGIKEGIENANRALNSRIDASLDSLQSKLSEKIENTESSMKKWVNEALAGYYDIAAIDAKLAALSASAEAGQDDLRKDLDSLSAKVDAAMESLTAAYKNAVAEAITDNKGIISNQIASAIDAVETRLKKEISDFQAALSGLESRVKALETIVGGLRVSNIPYGLVFIENPADTMTKGETMQMRFRINPSGVKFTKDMLLLDCFSSLCFSRKDPGTRASYVKSSEHFSISSLEADKDAAGSTLDGQYVLKMAAAANDAVWDESILAFVGAYKDHEGKIQYFSTQSYPVVMMPRPDEGLNPWYYPNATFQSQISGKNQDGNSYVLDTLGAVFFALDGVDFIDKEKKTSRRYSAGFLKDAVFTPDAGYPPLHAILDTDRHYVRFYPDTTGNDIWRAFQDQNGTAHQDVKGTVTLTDRWGATASYQLSMAWYNTINLVENVTVKMSDLNLQNPIVSVDMTESFKSAGYDASLIKDGMRIQSFDIYSVNWDSDFVFEPVFRQNSRILNLELHGTIVPGASNAQMIKFTVSSNPSYVYREFTATQIRMDVTINLRII